MCLTRLKTVQFAYTKLSNYVKVPEPSYELCGRIHVSVIMSYKQSLLVCVVDSLCDYNCMKAFGMKLSLTSLVDGLLSHTNMKETICIPKKTIICKLYAYMRTTHMRTVCSAVNHVVTC